MSLARCCAILVLCAAWLPVTAAHADEVDPACATAYAKGQDDRLAGRLYDARSAFQRCAVATCPQQVARDCATWASEVEADLPTAVISVTDSSGRALPSWRAFVDGAPIAASELARPLVLEAGPHSLRFEADGYETATVQTALRPTDRELPVRVILRTPAEKAPPAPRPSPRSAGVPPLSLVFAGVGAVALGTSAYFGFSARNQYQDLKDRCAPGCTRSEADAVASKALLSDVALATSLVALGAAAWIYFGTPETSRAAVVLSSRPNGGQASVRVIF
jgi:hypothetical protein